MKRRLIPGLAALLLLGAVSVSAASNVVTGEPAGNVIGSVADEPAVATFRANMKQAAEGFRLVNGSIDDHRMTIGTKGKADAAATDTSVCYVDARAEYYDNPVNW